MGAYMHIVIVLRSYILNVARAGSFIRIVGLIYALNTIISIVIPVPGLE